MKFKDKLLCYLYVMTLPAFLPAVVYAAESTDSPDGVSDSVPYENDYAFGVDVSFVKQRAEGEQQ